MVGQDLLTNMQSMSFGDHGSLPSDASMDVPRPTANHQTLADMTMLEQASLVDKASSSVDRELLLSDVPMGEGMASSAPVHREPSPQVASTSLAVSGHEVSSPAAQTSPVLSNHAVQESFPLVNDESSSSSGQNVASPAAQTSLVPFTYANPEGSSPVDDYRLSPAMGERMNETLDRELSIREVTSSAGLMSLASLNQVPAGPSGRGISDAGQASTAAMIPPPGVHASMSEVASASPLVLVTGAKPGTTIHNIARALRSPFHSGGCGVSISGYAAGQPDGSFVLQCPNSRAGSVVKAAWHEKVMGNHILNVSFIAASELATMTIIPYHHPAAAPPRRSSRPVRRYQPYPPSSHEEAQPPGTLLPPAPHPPTFGDGISQGHHNFFAAARRVARKRGHNISSSSPG